MSVLQQLIQDCETIEFGGCSIHPNGHLELIIDVRVKVEVMTEEEFDVMDNDYTDPDTGTVYYMFSSDLDDNYRWANLNLEVRGEDLPFAIDIVTKGLSKLV